MSVREGLLALLADGPRHGYDLRATFEARTAKLWHLNSGQVYTTLDRLERDGLVTPDEPGDADSSDDSDTAGRRRPYRLTAAGRDELARWLDAGTWTVEPQRDDLLMKVLLIAEDPTRAGAVIDAHRHALLAQLQRLRQEQRHAPDDRPLAEHLVTDALVARLDADLHWLDRCDERLARQTSDRTRTHPQEHRS